MRTIGVVCVAVVVLGLLASHGVAQESSPFEDDQVVSSAEPAPSGEQDYFQSACDATCGPCVTWHAGFQFVLLKPQFENNVAFTTMESDGVSFETFTTTEFDYDLHLSPRIWTMVESNGVGLRAQFWQFDHAAGLASASPPANGFGQITHPLFGAVDIGTRIPSDTFTASTGLNAYTFDFEGTVALDLPHGCVTISGGFRYGSIDQTYEARTTNAAGTLLGSIDYDHGLYGIGPTVALGGEAYLTCGVSMFSNVRGSLLFGEANSRLLAGEDLDLTTPFFTRRTEGRDDLLPIGEMQLGLKWSGCFGRFQPFASVALEGQLWSGVGNATSEQGDLGFFGTSIALGSAW